MKLIPHSFFVLLLTLCFYTTVAQPALCLSKDPETNLIDFRSDELNNYLHLDNYKIIFFGEQHNANFDPEIKYHLITDINKRTGTRHVFMEISVSKAWHFNRYLETGDTSYLYSPLGRYSYNKYLLFWKRLYTYNNKLPDSAKIVIHGIDFERTDVFLTVKQLSPTEKPIPLSLRAVMDTINIHLSDPPLAMWDVKENKFILYDNSVFIKTLQYIQNQFLVNIDDTKAYFDVNFPIVDDIIKNKGEVEVRAKHRNKTMFAAMQKIIDAQHIDRFIGFFGNQHTTYSVTNSLSNASKRLRNIDEKDILHIAEMAYNLKSTDTVFRIKHYHEIVALNGSCQATVLAATAVPGFKAKADFVIIANIGE